VVRVTHERSTVRFVSDTTPDRPRFRVRREAILERVPQEVDRSATGLSEFFGISRSRAWRLFLDDRPHSNHPVSADSIAAICATFPGANFDDLFVAINGKDKAR
jgi:hypothetical protein